MRFSPNFYRVAGIASILSVATTLMLIFLPQFFAPVAEDISGRMQRVTDPVYQLRAWAYQIHPFLVFTACLGLAAACRRALSGIGIGRHSRLRPVGDHRGGATVTDTLRLRRLASGLARRRRGRPFLDRCARRSL